ncbi:MAG: hypothetical protein HY360_04840 [Verrucomicrobia bacterium]|nr:hypothetical protein [Verrucomicrobiota bacterium]
MRTSVQAGCNVDIPAPEDGSHFARQCRQRWAALIKQVYEIDPLICPQCGGRMRIIAFIERRQEEVIRKNLSSRKRGFSNLAAFGRSAGGLRKPLLRSRRVTGPTNPTRNLILS